ncbi:MAG: hypothetical protein C4527_15205 [Candidatus Omnitrophota bacterium]|jgi:DNA uptake protein ComE-like DNA-binding protein|nr:MAG: hypothetical protein C4527_15205 [Candidatus Omnitrophota bacterium]
MMKKHISLCDSLRGSILIIVLWISAGLVSVALLFGRSMMLEYRAAENMVAQTQAEQAMEGAVRYVMYILANAEEPGVMPASDSYESEAVIVGDALFWLIGRGDLDVADERPVFGLIDEASKLNLNTATLEMLEMAPGMTSELAAAIIDWRDEDDEVSSNGAESQAYMARNPGYECKNAPFESIAELHLLFGADWDVLYGEDANLNGVLDPNENDGNVSPPADNQNGRLEPGILEYVTVYSRESTADKININSEDSEELTQLLQDTFEEDRASQIEQNTSGTSEYGSLLEYFIRSGMTLEEFAQIDDQLTVSEESSIEGLVNINTAGVEVLACLPGIGSNKASQVVSYRQSHSDDLDSVAWLSEVLDEDGAIEAGPYITANTYRLTADIIAVGRNDKGYRRTQFLIDVSGESPEIRYRRDLSGWGWALGREIRNQLALVREQGK